MRHKIRTSVMGLRLAIVTVTVVALLLLICLGKERNLVNSISESRRLAFALGETRVALQDAEVEQRTFLLTGSKTHVVRFRDAARRAGSKLDDLLAHTPPQSRQRTRVEFLREVARQRLVGLEEVVQASEHGGRTEMLAALARYQSEHLTEQSRSIVSDMESEEIRNVTLGAKDAKAARGLMFLVVITGCALLLVLIVSNVLAIRRDVTLWEQITERLQQSQERLSTTLASIGDAVIATDGGGVITFMNAAAEQLTGWNQSAAIGLQIGTVLRAKDACALPAPQQPVQQLLSRTGGSEPARLFSLVRADDATIAVEANCAPINGPNGAPTGAILVFRDVTERSRLEEETRAAHAAVVDLNTRLRRAMTETHHRVKNSLQVMAALIDIQASSDDGRTEEDRLDQFRRQIHALAVVHDLLTESSKDDRSSRVSARNLLSKLLHTTSEIAAPRGLLYYLDEIEIPSEAATPLALVANELVLNALKHGTGRIAVALKRQGECAALIVEDEGPGLPADFDPAATKGTGTTLVESLVQMDLGGTVTYSNREDVQGTRVVVSFPAPKS